MNIPDFKAIDSENLKEQILLTCEQFDTHAYGQSSTYVMRLAHPLAEQILAQYGTLRKASEALVDKDAGQLLPKTVRLLFASAVMYPHPTLGILMDELVSLYGHKNHSELAFSLARARNQPWAKNLPDIQLFDAQGMMQYQPLAFRVIHPKKFWDEVSFLFYQGEAGVKRIMSHYPQMSEGSRQIMDLELGRRIYERMPGDDDGLRELLKDKLNPVHEAQVRIEKMMNQEITSDPHDYFMKWHNLAFDQIDTLSPEGAAQAIKKLTQCVERHVIFEGDDAELTNEVEPVQCMIQVLKRAMPHGFEVLPIIGKALELDPESPEFLRKLIDFQMTPRDFETSRSIWMKASLVALDEDKLIALNLEPEQLGWLARTTGSAKYRAELKKSSRGREIVFGQDLGL